MSIATDVIRQFWMPGLNNVSGNPPKGLGGWFCDEEYHVYDPLEQDRFVLTIPKDSELLSAFAFDCNRMAIASFESMIGIAKIQKFPKSMAWLVIKYYYSAFFAAHAILRMLGISCSQLQKDQTISINRIADLYSQTNNKTVSQGFYKCEYDSYQKKLSCEKINSRGGVHETFWKVFYQRIGSLNNDILTKGRSPSQDQPVSTKLLELCDNLSYRNNHNGAWLSFIRNEVNYRHQLGSWFPYKDHQRYYFDLHDASKNWLQDPMKIVLFPQKDKKLMAFVETCNFITGLCRVLVEDMSQRCSRGRSFHTNGSVAFLRHFNQSQKAR